MLFRSTKLDVVWDLDTPTYTTGRTNPYSCDIVSLNLDTNGNFVSIKAKGNISEIRRYSGKIKNKTDNTITINKFYTDEYKFVANNSLINVLDSDITFSFGITGLYETANEIVLYCNNSTSLANTNIIGLPYTLNFLYSRILTDESGKVSGIFYLPNDTFHTGEKPFRIDNRLGENPGSETTFAETKFFATSLNQQKQSLNW